MKGRYSGVVWILGWFEFKQGSTTRQLDWWRAKLRSSQKLSSDLRHALVASLTQNLAVNVHNNLPLGSQLAVALSLLVSGR